MTKEQQQDGTQPFEEKQSQCPDVFGSTGGDGLHHPPRDSNDESPHMGGFRGPFSGGFVVPPPLYPDPLMLWMHHMQRQAAYLHLLSGPRNGYPHSASGGPSGGLNQRGFIKVPSGMPQKQSKLWETQSAENVQLWAAITQLCSTIARSETEISFQRVKIMKLEDDLQAMKVQQDALIEALKKNTSISPQQGKVARAKRNVTSRVAILGLPATQPSAHQAKKARVIEYVTELTKGVNEDDSEGRSKDMLVGCLDRSGQEQSKASTSLIVGLKGGGFLTDIPDGDHAAGQQAINDASCVFAAHSTRQESQTNPDGSPLADKPSTTQEVLEMKTERSAMPHEDADSKHVASSAGTRCVSDCSKEMEGEREGVYKIGNGNKEVAISIDCRKTCEGVQKDDLSEGILVDAGDAMEESRAFDNDNADALNIISLFDCPNELEEVPTFGREAANTDKEHQDGGACI